MQQHDDRLVLTGVARWSDRRRDSLRFDLVRRIRGDPGWNNEWDEDPSWWKLIQACDRLLDGTKGVRPYKMYPDEEVPQMVRGRFWITLRNVPPENIRAFHAYADDITGREITVTVAPRLYSLRGTRPPYRGRRLEGVCLYLVDGPWVI